MAINRHFFSARRLTLVGVLFVMLLGAPLYAQSNDQREEITLTPTAKEHRLSPGESIRDSFKVVNTGEKVMDFTVYARPYSVTGEDNSSSFNIDPEVNPRSDAYSWVQFEKASWRLEPSDTAEIIYELRVPEN